jgi:hypothetical protein
LSRMKNIGYNETPYYLRNYHAQEVKTLFCQGTHPSPQGHVCRCRNVRVRDLRAIQDCAAVEQLPQGRRIVRQVLQFRRDLISNSKGPNPVFRFLPRRKNILYNEEERATPARTCELAESSPFIFSTKLRKVIFMSRKCKRQYGFFHLLFDFVMTLLTSGLWLIWVVIRFLGRNS